MRDLNRIDKFCDELKTIWHQVPDWRFTQLIINADQEYRTQHSYYAPFYIEDEEYFKFLSNYIKETVYEN